MRLGDDEAVRYSRQIILPEVGEEGQARLRRAAVLVAGVGGLGSVAALYLAAAGVGVIGVADSDQVELSNLQRQIIHFTPDIGRPKVDSGRDKLTALNPEVQVRVHRDRIDAASAPGLIEVYDVVVGAVDNVPARYALNDACVAAGKPLVEAGILGFNGLLMTILPREGPCYRCVFPEPPPPESVATCAGAGVIGALPGVMGSIQALEVTKLIIGKGKTYSGRLLTFDGLSGAFRTVPWPRNPGCPACGRST